MKRTPLKRKTPLKRGPWSRRTVWKPSEVAAVLFRKPRKRLPQRSAKRKREDAIYDEERRRHLTLFPWCQMNVTCGGIWVKRNIPGVRQAWQPRKATQIHHTRGRGKWYTDRRYFKSSCTSCHRWENDHRNEAVKLGLRERVR